MDVLDITVLGEFDLTMDIDGNLHPTAVPKGYVAMKRLEETTLSKEQIQKFMEESDEQEENK